MLRPACASIVFAARPVFFLAIALAAVGCGRPATEEECAMIVDKNIDVAIDPAITGKDRTDRIANYRKQIEGETKKCEGMRVTDKYIACVRAAKTAADVTACGK